MFVTVKINAEIDRGTLVCHDVDNVWRAATSADNAPLGVLTRETTLDDDGVRWGKSLSRGLHGPEQVHRFLIMVAG